jgi:hypothetical protein
VKTQRPIAPDDDHRVIQFRPRNARHAPQLHTPTQAQSRYLEKEPDRLVQPLDLSRYEKPRPAVDDFRQRMLANIAAFAFTVALTAVGIWLAMSIADLRRTQDCVLMGRRDCVHISTH